MAAPVAAFDPTQTHIAYLHAWPLIGKLGTGDPFPIKKLDFESERSLLFHTLNQAQKSIRLQMEVATSDNLLRLITMGVRAIHYTGHGMPTCFPADDTRVLTNHGFLFLHEIQALQKDATTPLLYACYDATTRQLIYRPQIGQLTIKPDWQGKLVDFTHSEEQHAWDAAHADGLSKDASDVHSSSNQFSLRVTPEHDMFVQRGSRRGSGKDSKIVWAKTRAKVDKPHRKVEARDLIVQNKDASESPYIRMLACAEAGIACNGALVDAQLRSALGLESSEQVSAFLALYGFWLGSDSHSVDALRFVSRSSEDIDWIRSTLARTGLAASEWSENRGEFSVTALRWCGYFASSSLSSAASAEPNVKSFGCWWRECNKAQLQLMIDGLQRAAGSCVGDNKQISTSSVAFRDELSAVLLHAGFTAYFTHAAASGRDSWRVVYTNPSSAAGQASSWPVLECNTDVREQKYRGTVWCPTVDHPDHLIVAQRAHRDAQGVVTRASRPVIVGQCLAFEDEEGKMHPMDPAQLKELVEAGRGSVAGGDAAGAHRPVGIEFVFVSACHSEAAGLAFVAAGVPHVIAVKTDAAVCDKASQIFMNHFYLALLVGKTVRASFDIAQKAVRHNPRLSGAASGDEPRKFLLLPEHANHDKTLFTDIPSGRWTDASQVPAPHTIPAIPENFLGRNFLLQKVIAHIARKRLITLTGVRGIGKTSVAVAAARYIWIRNRFDGVFMVDVRKLLPEQQSSREHQQHGHSGADSTGGKQGKGQQQSLVSLCSIACQLDETYHSQAKLFRALQKMNRILLILDGADILLPKPSSGANNNGGNNGGQPSYNGAQGEDQDNHGEGAEGSSPTSASSSPSVPLHMQHDIRGFISDFLRQVPNSKMLVTSTVAIEGIREVVEAQIPVKPLAPIDAAQLFYDLRPRDIELAEFGCDDPKRAAGKLSEHPALKLLAGHPRRIFNAVPLLRDCKMPELTALIQKQIQKEEIALQLESQALQHPHNSNSRTHTPEPNMHHHSHSQSQQQQQQPASAHVAPHPVSSASQQASDLFDHNCYLWFGGHGSQRSSALLAAGSPALSPDEEKAWSAATQAGCAFWRSSFGRVEGVPWSDSVERQLNMHFMSQIGSHERPLEALDLQTLQAKLESLGSPPGYMHVQVLGAFWRDWLSLCETVRKILPLWVQAAPTRIIHGWCNRQTCTNLLVESINPQTGALINRPVGTFALRLSESMVGSIAVGFVDQTNKILHTLISIKADSFLLNLTDGGRSYNSLSDLLLQCRPFMYLYPGIDKMQVLGANMPVISASGHALPAAGGAGAGAAAASALSPSLQQGEDSPSAHGGPPHQSPHVHTSNLSGSGTFQIYPNNASGGSVGLFSPPAPGSHGLAMPSMQHAQSHGQSQQQQQMLQQQQSPQRLPHPQSFPNLGQLAQALPSNIAASNPNAEGQPPAPAAPRGPSPLTQQEGLPSAPGGVM